MRTHMRECDRVRVRGPVRGCIKGLRKRVYAGMGGCIDVALEVAFEDA